MWVSVVTLNTNSLDLSERNLFPHFLNLTGYNFLILTTQLIYLKVAQTGYKNLSVVKGRKKVHFCSMYYV